MEVHAHTYTARKKWTHYFWEFIMLFLAVFCGFLAEYQLEHKIEKNREKQFMRSMIEDMKADTASISLLNQLRMDRLQMADSLSYTIIENKHGENGAAVYFWGRRISRRGYFFSSDGTMQQLKNSGGLRLIRSEIIADKIIAYDVLYRDIMYQQNLEEVLLNEYRLAASRIFDAAVFYRMTNLKDSILVEKSEGNPQLKDSSPVALNELVNKLNYWAVASTRLLHMLVQLKGNAIELIEVIKKEYHLK
jgi:hypothetical protein